MTLEQFIILRRNELVAFFKARFGRHWRQIVPRQANLNPRCFQRWKTVPPLSLCRRIHKLETWARSIGFQSATDEQVQQALREHRKFKEAAAREVEKAQTKRNEASPADGGWDWREFYAQKAVATSRAKAGEVLASSD
ncbi:MAG TPA: hypothetical protein VN578_22565 [Candidatus Binatia bacterium]|jgi:hypothetical protein|nr:hypothetical protein [Candidatus Binatia bacterium]